MIEMKDIVLDDVKAYLGTLGLKIETTEQALQAMKVAALSNAARDLSMIRNSLYKLEQRGKEKPQDRQF